MKRKILLTMLALSALLCLFVVLASAASTNEFGEIEYVSGMDEKSVFGDDGAENTFTSRVVLYDGAEYHTYPAYYIFTNDINTTTNFTQLNSLTGKSYGKTSVIRAEVPANVQKVIGDIFKGYNDLKYVKFPDTLTVISGNMFYTSHGLEWVNVPRDCISIQAYAFYGCSSLKTIDMSNAQSLKRTEANQFYNCPNLEELIFPEGFEYFGGAGGGGANQTGLKSLKTLYLPNSVTYMGSISEAKSLTTFTVPLGITSLNSNQINWSPGVNKVIIHKGVTSVDSNAFNMTLYINEIVYTGDANDAIVSTLKTVYSKAALVIGNHCKYYYGGEHLEDNNPCVINCERCASIGVAEENPVHNELTTIKYVSVEDKGVKTIACQNEGCQHKIESSTEPLFVRRGYSTPEYEATGVTIAYLINSEAIEEYEAVNGTVLTYGVFAALKERLGENDVFNEKGEAADGAFGAELSSRGFITMSLKMVGFDTELQKASSFAIGAFVGETGKDGTIKYRYLQDEAPTEGEKYYFTSYNELLG